MKRLLVVIAIGVGILIGLVLANPASTLSGNPNRAPMALISSEYGEGGDTNDFGNGPNGFLGCQDEDDHDRRWYSGWLGAGQSFSPPPVIFCSPYLTGFSDGNTGAWVTVNGTTDYEIRWWLEYWECRTVNQRCYDDYYLAVRELIPVETNDWERGHSASEVWRGCEAQVPGTVYATVTNVGSRGAFSVLGFGSRWHNTSGDFYYDCP